MISEDFSLKEDAVLNRREREYFGQEKIPRNELLDEERSQGNDSKLTFNVMYYPVFRHLKSQSLYVPHISKYHYLVSGEHA